MVVFKLGIPICTELDQLNWGERLNPGWEHWRPGRQLSKQQKFADLRNEK